jgi:hypothetical protein
MQTDSKPSNSLDIFSERLSKPVSTPVEQTVIEEEKTKPAPAAPPAKPKEIPRKEVSPAAPSPSGHDPYREPID